MRIPSDPALRAGEIGQQGEPGERLEVLFVDPDEQRLLLTLRELEGALALRTAQRRSGREALATFARARFDAIICYQDLGDTDCWRWIRMVRSGRFGYAATPVLVPCAASERPALLPMVDPHTRLIVDDAGHFIAAELRALRESAQGTRVLVVEDEERAARAAASALEKFYRVDVAGDGETALELWRARRHALVVLDLMLPRMSGAEVLAHMLSEEPGQPVLVLTAHDGPEQHQELMLAGAAEFVSKPVDLHALPELCARTLRAHACVKNAQRARAQEAGLLEIAGRVRAAQYHVERGQPARAGAHLRRAIHESRSYAPSDDEWASLLTEFELE